MFRMKHMVDFFPLARQLGFSPNGENSGNADNLCDYILLGLYI